MSDDATRDEFMSLTHIGWPWHVSNRVLGKALDDAGYRTALGTPSDKALAEGLAIKRPGSGYGWSQELVDRFICQHGLSERSKPIRRQMFLTEPIEFS